MPPTRRRIIAAAGFDKNIRLLVSISNFQGNHHAATNRFNGALAGMRVAFCGIPKFQLFINGGILATRRIATPA